MRGLLIAALFSTCAFASCVVQVQPTGHDDTAMLQASVDQLDATCPSGGTLDLGTGNYWITGTWKIASSARQHHINIYGVNPIATTITCSVADSGTCIYLNLEKYATLKNFTLWRQDNNQWGTGIALGGDLGTGEQSNGLNFEAVNVANFHYGIMASGGLGTSGETIFSHLVLQNNVFGFYAANDNATDFRFDMLEMWDNGTGVLLGPGGPMVVTGGGSQGDGIDFDVQGGVGTSVKIIGFRAEVFGRVFLRTRSNQFVSIENCVLAPNVIGSEVIEADWRLEVRNSELQGYIAAGVGPGGSISIEHSSVNTAGSTWATNSPTTGQSIAGPYFPGLRLGGPWIVSGNPTRITVQDVRDDAIGFRYHYPDFHAVVIANLDGTSGLQVVSQP